ncbi:MAG: hypothetical protein ABS862_06900 [Carnobacterium inhibens]|uniref:hypothetical protein n=1 Tax=Carnobacterium sp. TaxID=48221 RepID=UPI00331629B7
MTIRKNKFLALFIWMVIIFAFDSLSNHYSLLNPQRHFGFPVYLIGVMITKSYINKKELKEQKL